MTILMLGYQNHVIGTFFYIHSGVLSEVRYVTTLGFHQWPYRSQES